MKKKIKKEIISMLDDREMRRICIAITDTEGAYRLSDETSEYIFNVMASIVGWKNGKKKNV